MAAKQLKIQNIEKCIYSSVELVMEQKNCCIIRSEKHITMTYSEGLGCCLQSDYKDHNCS